MVIWEDQDGVGVVRWWLGVDVINGVGRLEIVGGSSECPCVKIPRKVWVAEQTKNDSTFSPALQGFCQY